MAQLCHLDFYFCHHLHGMGWSTGVLAGRVSLLSNLMLHTLPSYEHILTDTIAA